MTKKTSPLTGLKTNIIKELGESSLKALSIWAYICSLSEPITLGKLSYDLDIKIKKAAFFVDYLLGKNLLRTIKEGNKKRYTGHPDTFYNAN